MIKALNIQGFDGDTVVENGNKLLIGNGNLGYRGTLDEFGKAECVGLNIAGLYDGVKGKWRETVNAFNPLYMHAFAGDASLDVRGKNVISHETSLDISRGIFSRKTTYGVRGATVTLQTERFVSLASKNNICSRTVVTSDKDMLFVFRVGVDTDIWELNGPHFKNVKTKLTKNIIEAAGVTQERGRKVKVACSYSGNVTQFDNGFGLIVAYVKAGESFTLDRLAYVTVDGEKAKQYADYDDAIAEHTAAWSEAWNKSRVILDGDERGQFALDYSIYHLLIIAPKGDYSIAARGLSGQTYKGAVFWDTEIFMLPFYLTALPDVAEKLVKYRINTLPAAKEKAKHYGYGGAFYAWESQDGYDACSDFNVTDVFTHRPVRTYFKDKQIHISADVAYAVLQYYSRTGDDKLMLDGGLETVLECAEFGRQYSYYNHVKKRYELLDVIGPDEYHERVNNNAFTNYMFYKITLDGVAAAKSLAQQHPQETEAVLRKFAPDILETLIEWAQNLYLPQPNADGVIEQFDGYFGLEDVAVAEVKSRLAHPREYWGGSGGVATATMVIKQADVIMLFNLYPDLFPIEIQRKNYEFYLPYTEHGSSLSHCAYALTACRIGKPDDAYSAFLDSAEIDLRGGGKQWAGDVYIGGTHPAASGGAWMAANAIYGKKRRLIMNFKGIIFDLDGVICSTDEYHYLAWKALAEELGIHDFNRDDNMKQRGVSRMESLEVVLAKSDKKYTAEQKAELADKKNDMYKQMLKNMSLKDLDDDVLATLKALRKAGLKLAIGSSSKNTPAILKQIGLDGFFDAVADGNCITKSKPDPEVFLKAAEMIGEKPQDCLVVEDAYSGIEAGKNGGFTTAGIGTARDYERTDIRLDKFSDLLKL